MDVKALPAVGAATLAFFCGHRHNRNDDVGCIRPRDVRDRGRILPSAETRVDVGELLRTLGFAATPGLIQVFGVSPIGAITPRCPFDGWCRNAPASALTKSRRTLGVTP
jgi:hypothetical protein